MTQERASQKDIKSPSPSSGLVLGILAAFGASVCCIGPLLLAGLGVGGSLAAGLRIFDPWRPILIVLSASALLWAFTRLRKASRCGKDRNEFSGRRGRSERLFWIAALVSVGLIVFPWIKKMIH